MMTYLHWCTRKALKGATLLFTVSNHAKREIAVRSGFAPERIVPVPHAPTPDLRRITDVAALNDVRRRYGLVRPFILADAVKNPAVLVEAWQRMPQNVRDRYLIVFFSRRPDPLPIVADAVGKGEARFLARPSREDLIALYSLAEVFVFPSWIEGFGIPLLEAMTCGAPVIASDRGAIPEVVGDAGLLADAEDAEAFSRHLVLVLGEPAEAQRLRDRGFARAAQFSWQETAGRILEGYCQALAV
jgi:glycosyltransferase involved in cell wall biosynthesis